MQNHQGEEPQVDIDENLDQGMPGQWTSAEKAVLAKWLIQGCAPESGLNLD